MSTRLGEADKKNFLDIVEEDIEAIKARVSMQVHLMWDAARKEVMRAEGKDELEKQKKQIKREIAFLTQKMLDIENKLHDKQITVAEGLEFNGRINKYGKVEGANFWGIPIASQFDYRVAKYIEERVDISAPAKFIYDLARSSQRELIMVGTFEEAQQIYTKFYELDFRKYGVDIPPRLAEIKELTTQSKELLGQKPKQISQIESKKDKGTLTIEATSKQIKEGEYDKGQAGE